MEGNPNYEPNVIEYPTTTQYYGQETFYPWISETSKKVAREVYRYKIPINIAFALGTVGYVGNQARLNYLQEKKRRDREMAKELEYFEERNRKMITSKTEKEPKKEDLMIEKEDLVTDPYYSVEIPKSGVRRIRGLQQHDKTREDASALIYTNIKQKGLNETIKNLSKQEDLLNSLDMRQLLSMISSEEGMQRALNEGQYIPKKFREFLPEEVQKALKSESYKWVPKEEYKKIKEYWTKNK